jgi:hypothetical protein
MPAQEEDAAPGEVRAIARRLLVIRDRLGRRVAVRLLPWRTVAGIALVDLRLRQIDAAAHRFFFDGPDRKMRRQKAALDLGVVRDAGRRAEHLLVDVQMNRGFVVGGRHQDRLVRRDSDAKHRRRVQIGEEDQDVVLLMVALQVFEQRGTPRSLLPEPLHLVIARVGRREDPFGVPVEDVDVALLRVCEPADGDAANAVGALGILVLPGDVVLRAGRQHVDLMLRREPLRYQAAVVLRSAEDLRSITLDDEGNFQVRLSSTCASFCWIFAGAKSARRRR